LGFKRYVTAIFLKIPKCIEINVSEQSRDNRTSTWGYELSGTVIFRI